jgi:ribonuclease P protein component
VRETFKKPERLCSKILIEKLFENGNSFISYPFRVTWLIDNLHGGSPVQVLIVVSKRRVKLAVTRNKIKRLIREAYRKNKHIIYNRYSTSQATRLLLCINYIGKTNVEYKDVERKLILILHSLMDKDG